MCMFVLGEVLFRVQKIEEHRQQKGVQHTHTHTHTHSQQKQYLVNFFGKFFKNEWVSAERLHLDLRNEYHAALRKRKSRALAAIRREARIVLGMHVRKVPTHAHISGTGIPHVAIKTTSIC
jgi:hypothetical protein